MPSKWKNNRNCTSISWDNDNTKDYEQDDELSREAIMSVFESRPSHDLLSPQALTSLYKEDIHSSPKDIEGNAYTTLLPFIKKIVAIYKEHPDLASRSDFRIACAVCPEQMLFRGWSALHIHAKNFWKCFPHQHKGYCRALTEVLRAERVLGVPPIASHAWPPILLVENSSNSCIGSHNQSHANQSTRNDSINLSKNGHVSYSFDGSLRRWKGLQGVDIPKMQDMELEEILAVFKSTKRDNEDDRNVIVFPASEIGLINTESLTEVLEKFPCAEGSLKLNVRKAKHPDEVYSVNDSFANDDDEDIINVRNRNNNGTGTSQPDFDYESHHPLGTWATLKEIKENGRVQSIIGKWTNGSSSGKSFTYKWPFRRSQKLKEMEVRFQKSLNKYRGLGASGNEKLHTQLSEIENQLKKERLLWLKDISGVREHFSGLEKDIRNEEGRKALARQAWEARYGREDDDVEVEEIGDLSHAYESQIKHMAFKKKQKKKEDERKRDRQLRGLFYEKNRFRRQAESAKDERDCLNKSIEHEEMMDAINQMLETCDCQNDFLVTMLVKCGHLQEAHACFTHTHPCMMANYVHDYRWYQIALYASSCMQGKEEEEVNPCIMQPPYKHLNTLANLIKECGSTCDLKKGKKLHVEAEKKGFTSSLFISTSLIRMYGKCYYLADAEAIFMGLHRRDVFSWNAILSTYLENDHPINVLLGFRQFLEEEVFTPDLITFTIVFRACGTLGEHQNVVVEGEISCVIFREIGCALHSHIRKKKMALDAFVNDAIVSMYGKCGCSREAVHVLQTSYALSVTSWNSIMTTFLHRDEGASVLLLYREMQKQGISPDMHTFVASLRACTTLVEGEEDSELMFSISLEIGQALHVDASRNDHVSNIYVANALVSMYGKCGNIIGAEYVFNFLPCHDVVSWNTMLSTYVQHFQIANALHMFRQMLNEEIHQDMLTFVIVLQACGGLVDNEDITTHYGRGTKVAHEIGQAIHAYIRKQDRFHSNIFVNNTLISMYGKCGNISEAENIFQSLCNLDLVSYNAMMSAYVEHGKPDKALQLYRELKENCEDPNKLTYVICLQACSSLANEDDGKFAKLALLEIGQAFHLEILKKGLLSDVVMDSALINMYGKIGMIPEAETVFCSKLIQHNSVTLNVMISAYIENGYVEKALELYTKMEVDCIRLDAVTILCVLQACSETTNLHLCKRLHFSIISTGLDTSSTLMNTLLNAYGCCASLLHASAVFSSMPEPDMVSWNACIAGYAHDGNLLGCLQVFQRMHFTGVKADCVTILSLLYACSHDGKVNEGLEYFELLMTEFDLYPDLKHYVAMLDLLGRNGDFTKIEHALQKGLPMETNVSVWLCVLGACRTHGNIELGNRVFENAVKTTPDNTSAYILLSNLYVNATMVHHP